MTKVLVQIIHSDHILLWSTIWSLWRKQRIVLTCIIGMMTQVYNWHWNIHSWNVKLTYNYLTHKSSEVDLKLDELNQHVPWLPFQLFRKRNVNLWALLISINASEIYFVFSAFWCLVWYNLIIFNFRHFQSSWHAIWSVPVTKILSIVEHFAAFFSLLKTGKINQKAF